MDTFGRVSNYWDIAQQPSTFSTLPDDDFLALLQRQFPTTITGTPKPLDLPPDGVDPQNINTFPLPNPSPPSSDSSPSPPALHDTPRSRPQSGVFGTSNDGSPEDPTLKRKANDEDDMDDEEPSHKSGTSSHHSRKQSSSRRKSTGNPQQDEFRLLKRKEQNRAAQRAFRERKEKHVKDLEDKVAALEAKNQAAESENGNLRDLLSRLQRENVALKQSPGLTFPTNKDATVAPNNNSFNAQSQSEPASSYTSPVSSSSKSPINSPDMLNQSQQFNFDFHRLIPFDPSAMNAMDDPPQHTATDGAMTMDFSFSGLHGGFPYRTLASNPIYTSFAEPMSIDLMSTQAPQATSRTSSNLGMDSLAGLTSFDSWSQPDSLDSLFGGNYMGAQSPVDFAALLNGPSSALSPILHHGLRSNTGSSAASPAVPHHTDSSPLLASTSSQQSTPNPTTDSSSVPSPASSAATPATPANMAHSMGECPRTKDDIRSMINEQGHSAFVEPPAPQVINGAFVRKQRDGSGPMIVCETGSSFPKTQKSDQNVEVLTAWRTITSNPQFKDVDINELCTEFTSKARCDGSKVVLEPEGIHRIMEALIAKRVQQQQ